MFTATNHYDFVNNRIVPLLPNMTQPDVWDLYFDCCEARDWKEDNPYCRIGVLHEPVPDIRNQSGGVTIYSYSEGRFLEIPQMLVRIWKKFKKGYPFVLPYPPGLVPNGIYIADYWDFPTPGNMGYLARLRAKKLWPKASPIFNMARKYRKPFVERKPDGSIYRSKKRRFIDHVMEREDYARIVHLYQLDLEMVWYMGLNKIHPDDVFEIGTYQLSLNLEIEKENE